MIYFQGCVDIRSLPSDIEIGEQSEAIDTKGMKERLNMIEKRSLLTKSPFLNILTTLFGDWNILQMTLVPDLDVSNLPYQPIEFVKFIESHLHEICESIQCDWTYKVQLTSLSKLNERM